MRIRPERDAAENMRATEAFFVGDVRDVLYSRAGNVVALPNLFDGLGACGAEDPSTVGESIVFRSRAAKTPPSSDAGLKIDYRPSAEGFYTPFFVGWKGRPSFTARFHSPEGMTVNRLYREIFSQLGESAPAARAEFVFLELVGLFRPDEIFDRALQKPVDRGEILTTSPENAAEFFRIRVIQPDLAARGEAEELFPLCVVGTGHAARDPEAGASALRESVFYRPPQAATPEPEKGCEAGAGSQVRTHNHALGWRDAGALASNLLAATQPEGAPPRASQEDAERSTEELLARPPDYLVHLDDWSVLRAASVKIYLADADRFRVLSVGGARR